MIPRPSPPASAAALLLFATVLLPVLTRAAGADAYAAATPPMLEPSIVYRSDESDTTAQGLASQPQFSGCGIVYNGNNSEQGTGAAIAANWVLTAKHVVTGYTTATFRAANGQSISGTVYTDSATDMALIKLDSNLITASGQAFTPVALITPNLPGLLFPAGPKVQPVGPLVWNVGYGNFGKWGGTVNGLDNRRRGGTNVVNGYGSSFLYFSNEDTSGTEFECTTGNGDSGGPMYLQTGYQWRIAAEVFGVSSGSFADTDVSFNNYLRTTTGINFAPQAAPTSLTWNAAFVNASTVASKNITNFVDGSGNWNTTRLNFVGATTGGDTYTYAWQNGTLLPVTFGRTNGATGTVTVTTPINISDLTFAASGSNYQIAGSGANGLTLAAAGSSITVNSGVTPLISAPLTGTGALTKLGPGALSLGGTNTYTGGTNITEGGVQIGTPGALGTSGNITVAGGAALNVAPLGTTGFTVASGRTLTNNGTLIGNYTVNGTLTGAGTFNTVLTINAGGLLSGTGGTMTVLGNVTNNGTIRLTGGAVLNASGAMSFVNNGVLDLISGSAQLPSNFSNGSSGVVVTSSNAVKVKSATRTGTSFALTIDSHSGHTYQLQRGTSPSGAGFVNLGSAQSGSTGTTLTFTDPSPAADQGFYRVVLTP